MSEEPLYTCVAGRDPACRARRLGLNPMTEYPCVPSIILIGSVLCKVTLAVPTWGLSPDAAASETVRYLFVFFFITRKPRVE